jgi:hypothetical protein
MLRAVKEGKGGGHAAVITGAIVATSLIVWPAALLFLLTFRVCSAAAPNLIKISCLHAKLKSLLSLAPGLPVHGVEKKEGAMTVSAKAPLRHATRMNITTRFAYPR